MKIRSIRHNNRRKVFEVRTSAKTLVFPFSQAEPSPTIGDPIDELFVDQDAGREAGLSEPLPYRQNAVPV